MVEMKLMCFTYREKMPGTPELELGNGGCQITPDTRWGRICQAECRPHGAPDSAKDGESPRSASSAVLDFTADTPFYVSPAIIVAEWRPKTTQCDQSPN